MTEHKEKPTGLALLREPFPAHQISKLPKPTKHQTDSLKAAMDKKDFSLGVRCALCGQWHHKDVVHLDYVGHAALTDRLLDCDPEWNWQPMTDDGLPKLDQNSGMWIKLTVCGVTRLGYGHAEGKRGGDAVKEVIGDALRNAAMRFGAALDLWHKGDLHALDDGDAPTGSQDPALRPQSKPAPDHSQAAQPEKKPRDPKAIADGIIKAINECGDLDAIKTLFGANTRASAAWDWLAMEAPDHSQRVNEAKAAREDKLTLAPF